MEPTSAKLAPLLDADAALRWLSRAPAGATALMVTTARERAVRVTANPDAMKRIHAALDAAIASGATRALLWSLDGTASVGEAIAIVGAVAEHRAQATRAVELLLAGLKGVAERTDL